MGATKAVRRFEWKRKDFPIKLEAYHPDTKAVVWSIVIEKPETLVHIPPLAKQLGHPVGMRTILAGGEVYETDHHGNTNMTLTPPLIN